MSKQDNQTDDLRLASSSQLTVEHSISELEVLKASSSHLTSSHHPFPPCKMDFALVCTGLLHSTLHGLRAQKQQQSES